MSWQEAGFWHMLTDWWFDSIRRKQVFWRIVEAWAGGIAALLTGWWWMWLTVPLAEWLLFEFILEPLGLAGSYWERL